MCGGDDRRSLARQWRLVISTVTYHDACMVTAASFQEALPRTVAACALPLAGARHDHDGLLQAIGESSLVLLGEASHGTHEFYRERARLTQRLIEEKGFSAVAVEADWPDAYRINRFVRGLGPDTEPLEALSGFERFPSWMWRNTDVLDFVGWLRKHNEAYPHRADGRGRPAPRNDAR